MRTIREVLRLKCQEQLPKQQIAVSCRIARSTVREYLKRLFGGPRVAVLGASNYTFCRASASQSLPDWIEAHRHAFAFKSRLRHQNIRGETTEIRELEFQVLAPFLFGVPSPSATSEVEGL